MRARGLIAIMEDADNNIVPEVAGEELAVSQAEVAGEAVELSEGASEISSEVVDASDAIDSGEELEVIQEQVMEAVESGEGMSEREAETASIAIETIRNRLGFDTTTRVVPATESFGNTSTRLFQTKMVVEGISDTLKTIWTNIKNFAIRVWEKIKLLVARIFSSNGQMLSIARALKERVNKLDGALKPKNKKLVNPTLAKAFAIKGKNSVANTQKVLENTGKLVQLSKLIGDEEQSFAKEIISYASTDSSAMLQSFVKASTVRSNAILKAAGNTVGSIDVAPIANYMGLSTKGNGAPGGSKKVTKATKHVFGPFIGGKVLTATELDVDFFGTPSTEVKVAFETQDKSDAAKEVEVLERADMLEILNASITLLSQAEDLKKTNDVIKNIAGSITKTADTVLASVSKLADSGNTKTEERIRFQALKEAVQDELNFMNSFGQQPVMLVHQTARYMLDYVSASMRTYTKAEGK